MLIKAVFFGVRHRFGRAKFQLFGHSPLDTTEQVFQENGVTVGLVGMAKSSVKCFTSIVFVVPDHGVVGSHFALFIAVLINLDQYVHILIEVLIIVELIFDFPLLREAKHRRVLFARHVSLAGLYVGVAGMAGKLPTCQLVVPGPAILRISSRVDAYVATSCLNIPLKSSLLSLVQYIAGGTQKQHQSVSFQVGLIK